MLRKYFLCLSFHQLLLIGYLTQPLGKSPRSFLPGRVLLPPNQQPWQVPEGIPAIVLPTPSQLLPLTEFYEPLFFMDVLSFK